MAVLEEKPPVRKKITRHRLPGYGKYGESTVQVRVPLSLVPFLQLILSKWEDAAELRPERLKRRFAEMLKKEE